MKRWRYIYFCNKNKFELEKNEDYIVEFQFIFKKAFSKTQSDGTSKQQAD